MLGYNTTEALYYHICNITNKSKSELLKDLDALVFGIQEIFKEASKFIFDEVKNRIEMTYDVKIEGENFLEWLKNIKS
jgi:hypothetical protein